MNKYFKDLYFDKSTEISIYGRKAMQRLDKLRNNKEMFLKLLNDRERAVFLYLISKQRESGNDEVNSFLFGFKLSINLVISLIEELENMEKTQKVQ